MLCTMKSKEILLGKCVNNLYSRSNLPKSEAEKYMALLKELSPECEAHVVEGDVNLYRLGFVSEVPCTLEIGFTQNEAERLYEQILDMETDAYCGEDILDKPYRQLDKREKKIRKSVLDSIKKYERFACLETLLYDCLCDMKK